MKYETAGLLHRLTFTKDDMVTLISLVFDGLEYAKLKEASGDAIAHAKRLGGERFVDEFKRLVLSADVNQEFPAEN